MMGVTALELGEILELASLALSTINHQPSTINHQLSALVEEVRSAICAFSLIALVVILFHLRKSPVMRG